MKTPKPIAFPEANKLLTKPESMTDSQCSSLPVYTDGRECISCWKLSLTQRLSALFFGRVWLSVLTGSGTQPPVWIDCARTVFIKETPKDCINCRWRVWEDRPKGKANPCGGCVGYDGTCYNWTHRKLWQILRDALEYTCLQIKERRVKRG